jgi:UDP-galactopyranose mutase
MKLMNPETLRLYAADAPQKVYNKLLNNSNIRNQFFDLSSSNEEMLKELFEDVLSKLLNKLTRQWKQDNHELQRDGITIFLGKFNFQA